MKRFVAKTKTVAMLACIAAGVWAFSASAAFTNLALHKTVTVCSSEGGLVASSVTDGDTLSRWGSNWAQYPDGSPLRDSAWAYIDLGAATTFDSIKIWWEHSNAVDYKIQTCNATPTANDQGWTTIVTVTGDTQHIDNFNTLSVHRPFKLATPSTARYLKIRCSKRNYGWGYSIHEVEVFNTQGTVTPPVRTNLALNKTATASSTRTGNTPNKAFDGAYGAVTGQGSRWETAWDAQPNVDSIRGNAWLAVDLGAKCTIDSVAIYWEHSGSGKFAIQVPKSDALPLSTDDAGWTTLVIDTTLKFSPIPIDMCITLLKLPTPTETRYVRVHSYKRIAGAEFAYGISIEEFQVFGVVGPTTVKPISFSQKVPKSDLSFIHTTSSVSIKANATGNLNAEIYSANGQLVRTVSGNNVANWDYKNSFGKQVMNGTYMVRVTTAGKTYQDKIAVYR